MRETDPNEPVTEAEHAAVVWLSIEALSDRYEESDQRWILQVVDLVDQLRDDVGAVQRRREARPGQKGATETLILALGSAGAFQAAVTVFRAWLARDRSRSLRLVGTDAEGRQHAVEISGESIDSGTLHDVAEILARRLPMK